MKHFRFIMFQNVNVRAFKAILTLEVEILCPRFQVNDMHKTAGVSID